MMEEVRLSELITLQRGFDITKKDQVEGDYPVISSGGTSSYHNQYKVEGPGVVIGRKGTLGTVFYNEGNFWPHDTSLWVKDFKGNDPKFIYYLLQVLHFEKFDAGAANPTLNRNHVHSLKLEVPKKEFRAKIASILSAYDDLIENNNHRIKLLEEMAEGGYKEWFVRLRFPGYQDTKFFDKEGNEVPHGTPGALPEGWERTTLPNYIDFLEGPGLRNYQYTNSGTHYLNIRVMGSNDLFLDKAGYLDTEEVNKRYPHFLLEENDHVVSSSGTIGRVVTIRKSHLPLCLNTSIIRMREKNGRFGTWLIKQFLKSHDFQGQIASFAIGAAQANFGPSHLTLMKATVPDHGIASKFEVLIGPMEEEIKVLLDKNKVLQETRDLLLPRLISGKLSVEELVLSEEINI